MTPKAAPAKARTLAELIDAALTVLHHDRTDGSEVDKYERDPAPSPVPMVLHCPRCRTQHMTTTPPLPEPAPAEGQSFPVMYHSKDAPGPREIAWSVADLSRALLESAERDCEQAEAQVAQMRAALEEIRNKQGKVCDEYETCEHRACSSSHRSWEIAEAALSAPPQREAERQE